jgi:hypothetical protein
MGNLWRKRPPKMPVDASQKGMRIYQIGGWYGSKNDHLVDVCNLLYLFLSGTAIRRITILKLVVLIPNKMDADIVKLVKTEKR